MTDDWQEEYARLMFGRGHTKVTMDKAAEIKYLHMPQALYKYREVNNKTIDALRRGVLFSSPARYLNDPFEAPIIVSDRAYGAFYQTSYDNMRKEYSFLPDATVRSNKELLDCLARAYGGSYEDIEQNCSYFSIIRALSECSDKLVHDGIQVLRKQAKDMYNICSLTSDVYSPLMWTYYAGGHSGFCIGYNIKERGITDNITQLTLPVLYGNNCTFTVDNIDDINGSICMYAMSWKTSIYAPEKEWRIFFTPHDKPSAEKMPHPSAVYLGAKMDETNKIIICEICKEQNIPVFQMMVNEEKQILYEMEL